jgi:2-keto-4-pentenoate hydratase/2-oxohepta-3-ene-1,7-dioic acid hydratase in catechol pathway
MKVLPVRYGGSWQLGVVHGQRVTVVNAARESNDPVLALLRAGPQAIVALREELRESAGEVTLALEEIETGPVIARPEKILCIGFNYRDHAQEMAVDLPSEPNVFAKFNNCLIGPGQDIVLPAASAEVDFEGELAVVIGRDCFEVPAADALGCVAGYTAFNDVSARDLQFQTSQWTLGKAIDTFAPIGPVLTLADAISDPQSLRLMTRVNGELMQDASTADMIFGVARIIASVSRSMTLRAGDIIATGTPQGVGWKRDPARFLHPGDIVEVEISRIGTLRNRVTSSARAGRATADAARLRP